jgi:hypothetical protein
MIDIEYSLGMQLARFRQTRPHIVSVVIHGSVTFREFGLSDQYRSVRCVQ